MDKGLAAALSTGGEVHASAAPQVEAKVLAVRGGLVGRPRRNAGKVGQTSWSGRGWPLPESATGAHQRSQRRGPGKLDVELQEVHEPRRDVIHEAKEPCRKTNRRHNRHGPSAQR